MAKTMTRLLPLPAFCLLLGACMNVGPDYEGPVIEAYQDQWVAGDSAVLEPGSLPRSDWWTLFGDETLESLVADARANNPDIAEAAASVAGAQAALSAARASGFPMGDVSGAVTRQKQSSASFGANVPFEFEAQTQYQLGAELSWEADLFGRTANSIARAEAALGGRGAMAADAARAIIAQTAQTYLTVRELDARIATNKANVARQQEVLDLTRQLREAGEVSDIDVERQTNLVESTQAGINSLKSARSETVASLARLTGHTLPAFYEAYPAFDDFGTGDLPPLVVAGPVEIGSPEDLLRRRPDIRAAERQLAAATYGVGIETADLYPSLSLTGQGSLTAGEPGELFSEDAIGYSFGPRLQWGIFNLPLTRAQIRQAEADVEAAEAAFRSAVLDALTETDAALLSYNYGIEEAAFRARALGAADRALNLIDIRYREGAESLLSLIDAQRQKLTAEDGELQARYEALRRRVNIYRAFGG